MHSRQANASCSLSFVTSLQPDESTKSSSPLVIKSANNDADWRLEEGDKPSRALQVVQELHSRSVTLENAKDSLQSLQVLDLPSQQTCCKLLQSTL